MAAHPVCLARRGLPRVAIATHAPRGGRFPATVSQMRKLMLREISCSRSQSMKVGCWEVTFLSFSVLICQMGVKQALLQRVTVKTEVCKYVNVSEVLGMWLHSVNQRYDHFYSYGAYYFIISSPCQAHRLHFLSTCIFFLLVLRFCVFLLLCFSSCQGSPEVWGKCRPLQDRRGHSTD